ncbi:type II CRISPR-associated endonuclease Cas1 [Methylobacillus caricis]|uniref:type II CRISPR-associated endonuclease Cas1 n=1 Tax=Methylobacillus caricis TaxID=1971611 RepID=UPI001D000A12|nr:type II CRISPR-associated endonuclease Cas1 [Methylobacillus caricis]MCB5186681.1 type II CRISPR-associated endonuclease Cas1 [Methylobacillus caricis]
MSDHRILLIENPASLSVDLGRLRIRRDGFDDSFVPPKDIAVLCLHHHTIQISVQALRVLAEAGASVMVTDEVHHPCAWLLPQVGNGDLVRRLRQQIVLDTSAARDRLWQAIVQARLNTQAANLRVLNRKGALRLERLAKEVQPADKTKCEGQGAKHYWAYLFDGDFKREKQGAEDALNARLNFGYAVLRSMVARSLVMAGLNPALGLGHSNMENPFNLADDFIEPYRFVVERHVALGQFGEFDGKARKEILSFIEKEIKLNGAGYRLPAAINESIASFVRVLDGRAEQLHLPQDALLQRDEDESWA